MSLIESSIKPSEEEQREAQFNKGQKVNLDLRGRGWFLRHLMFGEVKATVIDPEPITPITPRKRGLRRFLPGEEPAYIKILLEGEHLEAFLSFYKEEPLQLTSEDLRQYWEGHGLEPIENAEIRFARTEVVLNIVQMEILAR